MKKVLHRFKQTDPADSICAHYDEHGLVILGGFDIDAWFEDFFVDFKDLIRIKMVRAGLSPSASVFDDLLKMVRVDRSAVSSIHDATQTLPSLFKAMHYEPLIRLLRFFGQGPLTLQDLPRIRMDFPNEDQFADNEHQECFYYDAPERSINVWFVLAPISKDLGLLRVRPGSHRIGRLPADITQTKPRVHLHGGTWQEEHPQIEAEVERGDVIVFHNSLVHGSGRNRGDAVRCSVQFRYNYLHDEEYERAGWPTTYRVVSRFQLPNEEFDANRRFMKTAASVR